MGDTRLVSIDGATRVTGVALFVNGELKDYGKIDLSKSKDSVENRILDMGGKLLKTLDIWKPNIVYIEEPQGHGKNLKVSGNIHELIGIVKAWCIKHGATVETFAPSVWRKYLGFKQGSDVDRTDLKRQSVEAVTDLFGVTVTDDESDAILIGCAGINKYSGKEE